MNRRSERKERVEYIDKEVQSKLTVKTRGKDKRKAVAWYRYYDGQDGDRVYTNVHK